MSLSVDAIGAPRSKGPCFVLSLKGSTLTGSLNGRREVVGNRCPDSPSEDGLGSERLMNPNCLDSTALVDRSTYVLGCRGGCFVGRES